MRSKVRLLEELTESSAKLWLIESSLQGSEAQHIKDAGASEMLEMTLKDLRSTREKLQLVIINLEFDIQKK